MARTRVDQDEERAGATVTNSATPVSPSSLDSTLSRRASIRSDPHPSPTTASAIAAATSRADPSSAHRVITATSAATITAASGTEIQTASAVPHDAEPTRNAGQSRSNAGLTA